MAIEIQLTRGYTALIDDADFEEVAKFKWRATGNKWGIYAVTWMQLKGKGRHVYLHRFLLEFPKMKQINFVNGNTLDCRRENLRPVTRSQSQMSKKLNTNNSTGYRGVSFNKAAGKYKAYIKQNGKLIYLGLFLTAEEAASVYDDKAKELFGKFARLNELK